MPQVSFTAWVEQVGSGQALGSFPTDTVPALAARPDQGDRIYAAKQRPADKPLILMGATLEDLLPYVQGADADVRQWRQLTDRHWPGALTLVLPASDRVPPAINPQGTGTVGIRVPDHPLARHLLSHTGPLATTSVNRSGQPALTDMAAIATQFPEVLLLSEAAIASLTTKLGDLDHPASGTPSTVIGWQAGTWHMLRPGAITTTFHG
ncbi:MAG TPA: L-threonylcarbamoyladenylate synthase [Candidatus Obscuribacterales bacterium]